MKKVIILSESDLTRLVRRVIEEKQDDFEDDFEFDAKKHDVSRRDNLGDLKHESNKFMVHLDGFNSKSVQKAISNLDENVRFISFARCENADFSEVDFCNDFPELNYVNVKGTPNNFEETQGDCFEQMGDGYVYRHD
jgi:hypothetical protein